MHRSHQTVPTIPAWLVCDHEFIEKYGLGRVPPGRRPLRRFITNGYLVEAASLEAFCCRIRRGLADATFEQSKDRIRSDLWYGKRASDINQFIADLKTSLHFYVDDEELAKVVALFRPPGR